ncbi:hypothetical protein [Tenacibaculum sp. M341]|uniref:hypothetical protein n=1 Tax=Tenacibaculum sp. M341 TaxID=2530339 RepID=UPI001044A3C0|nr:hypothetical protein [Tenacibaculum sp. M341]TCI91089.1 hypothetical protein EYW44_12135 [Tenacibaculum sp. M341]
MRNFKFSSIAIALLLAATWSCSDEKVVDTKTPLVIPSNLSIADNTFFPEDIIIVDGKLFASGFGDGSVKSFDLTKEQATEEEFAPAETGYPQAWGFTSDGNVLLSNINNLNFTTFQGEGSKLIEYNISTGAKSGEWEYPLGTTAQSVQIVNGKYYAGDFSTPRIFKVDPVTNAVTNWLTPDASAWDPTKGGLGGMIYNGKDAFYVAQGGKLWYIPITSNGDAGTVQEVTVSGIAEIDIDGISWDGNNTIYYATNDASLGSNDGGVVYKVVLSDATTGEGSVVKSGLFNPSGVWYLSDNGNEYVFVAESQLGVFFGVTQEMPFNIEIIKL